MKTYRKVRSKKNKTKNKRNNRSKVRGGGKTYTTNMLCFKEKEYKDFTCDVDTGICTCNSCNIKRHITGNI